MKDAHIPKIDPLASDGGNEIQKIKQNSDIKVESAATGDSILIPKVGEPVVQKNENETLSQNNSSQPDFQNQAKPRYKKAIIITGIVLAILLILILVPGFLLFQSGKVLISSSNKLLEAGKAGNFPEMKTEMANVKRSLGSVKRNYTLLSWSRFIPFVGGYVSDLGHAIKAGESGLDAANTLLVTTEPYASILGFSAAEESGTGEKTTQERIDFIIKTIPDILPKIDDLSSKVKEAESEFSKINADRYPEKYKDIELRAKIREAQEAASEASKFIANSKPVLESAQYLLGMDSPRTYLVLFQNDKEIRPTGGFMTGYSIMKVDKAKFEPVTSDDIYNLDAKYKPSILAPDPLIKYIKGPYVLSKNIRLRDMNWSPDFTESMGTFTEAIKEVGVDNVDGIIAVDTHLLVNLLNVIGPIGVPGFGNFSNEIDPECRCPQVIHELESFADIEGPIIWDPLTGKIIQRPPNSDNRKKIIGPLMNSILSNALGQPKEKLPALFEAGFKSLVEKHVLFYMFDEKVEKGLVDFGLGGKILDYEGDYLHINDANLGGRKSNLYVTQDVEQDIEIARDGTVTKTVTLTYKNPEKYDGWLNSVLPNWVRVYVPKGSKLITVEGLEDKVDPYEDINKTVFAGLFQLRPEGVSKVTFKYELPMKFNKNYNLLIQKQPGTDGHLYTIRMGKYEEEFYLKTDKEIKTRI